MLFLCNRLTFKLIIHRLLIYQYNYTYHFDIVNSAAPTYFVPAQLITQIKQCQEAMSNLDAMNRKITKYQRILTSLMHTPACSILKLDLAPLFLGTTKYIWDEKSEKWEVDSVKLMQDARLKHL